MLSGVLLHVIHAARPVNLAVDGTCGHGCAGVVDYLMSVVWAAGVWGVNDFDYGYIA
jgi:hypothetical protein